MAMRDVA